MKRTLLYVFEPDNEDCRLFVTTLRNALPDFDISVDTAGVSTLLELRKYELVHFFSSADSGSPKLLAKFKGKAKLVQTLISRPQNPNEYKHSLFGEHCIVFTEEMKQPAEQHASGQQIHQIPPCVPMPDLNLLQPSSQVRENFQVEDRILALALNDVSSKSDFESFLYVVREYNRRGGFRFLIPSFRKDKQTLNWRSQLQERIDREKLQSTELLTENTDLHSLVDSSDITLYLQKEPNREFDVPARILEASSLGKPVLCFNVPPLNELLRNLQSKWICNNVEDIVRESKDIWKEAAQLEQISTELARTAREKFGVDRVAREHRELYEQILTEGPP